MTDKLTIETKEGKREFEILDKNILNYILNKFIINCEVIKEIKDQPKDEDYYDEGDSCPKCEKGMLVITQCNETGYNSLRCEDCRYDATEDEKPTLTNHEKDIKEMVENIPDNLKLPVDEKYLKEQEFPVVFEESQIKDFIFWEKKLRLMADRRDVDMDYTDCWDISELLRDAIKAIDTWKEMK